METGRRRLLLNSAGIAASVFGFGFVYGLAAHGAGFSPVEATAMSLTVFAGASQFAAVGYVAAAVSWPAIATLTALVNARHLLYSAALRPWLRDVPRARRALMAQFLTDEAFALSVNHFTTIDRADEGGFWIAAMVSTFIPWNVASLLGVLAGATVPDPSRLGLDVVFPAAMGALAVGLIRERRELVAGAAGAVIAVATTLVWGSGLGIVAGGLLGPVAGMCVPAGAEAAA